MKRMAAGSYRTLDRRYRIERGWADAPGTDRRRETWVLTRIDLDSGVADVLSDHATQTSAREELTRILGHRP